MRNRTTLREQLEAFKSGSFMDADGKVDTGCYNFYDWFCKDSSLERRARTLFGKLKTFINHNPQVDLDTHYVFFKNNCPMVGNLYDSFSICDRETGNVIYWVAPNHRGKAEIYSLETGFERPLKEADTFKALFAAA